MNSLPAKHVELLAPAGNMECFQAAMRFGADAVYLAGKCFGLRAAAANFTEEELLSVISDAHALGKKVYVVVNSLVKNSEFSAVLEYLIRLKQLQADAVVLSDPAVIGPCRELGLDIHISTQMSTMNYQSVNFWHTAGAKRIVMARELSLEEIRYICENSPGTIEIEAFVHGAMCVAYSGRCLLSAAFTGRSGNRGECAQPCRWKYTIHEEGYPEDFLPIFEDEKGTYILNSKDLMMIEHIPSLIQAGIMSLKIEGRMKSPYYVASVVNAYRRAIDAYYEAPDSYETDAQLVNDLRDCATRGLCTGFYFGNVAEASDIYRLPQKREYNFCALVRGSRDSEGMLLVEQRNKFSVGDTIRILAPDKPALEFTVQKIQEPNGVDRASAPHPQEMLRLCCPFDLQPGDMLKVKLRSTD